jgi:hypothetical protein
MDYLLHPRFTILTLLLSSYHAYLLDLYILSVMQILVVNAGIIYHNQFHKELFPNFRYVDIMIALCGMYYNAIYYSYYCYDSNMCVYFFTTAILFYLLGLYFNSNRLHCGIHIFSVIGNLALQECIYAGNNKSLELIV